MNDQGDDAMKQKKIVLLGAGSTAFTLQLVRDLVLIEDLKDCTLRLVDIHEGRLNDAKGVAELYKRHGTRQGNRGHQDARLPPEADG